MTNYELYMQSKVRVNVKGGDERDELIVKLWEKAATLVEERNKLRSELEEAKTGTEVLSRKVRTLTHDNELLESRLVASKEGPMTLTRIVQQAMSGGDDEHFVVQ